MTSVPEAFKELMLALKRSTRYRISRWTASLRSSEARQKQTEEARLVQEWQVRIEEHIRRLKNEVHDYKYIELVRKHASDLNWYYPKIIPLFMFPLLIQAKNIVELGSAFSYYPETYGDAGGWDVSYSNSEGGISTRILLTACRFLTKFGTPSKLTSIDIRVNPLFENMRSLFRDLDLLQYWNPIMDTDSVRWLQQQHDLIDFAFVDSNHTYGQVSAELENLVPHMSSSGIIVIDDVYVAYYTPHLDWLPNETMEGLRKGGQFGALLDFLEGHPEWTAEWDIWDTAYLYKRSSVTAR